MWRVVKVWQILSCAFIVSASVARADPIIFSNLGPGDTYDDRAAWTVGGPFSAADDAVAIGQSFAPAADVTFDAVEVALTWITGTNAATISLMSDLGGHPGTVLESFQFADLPQIGTTNTELALGDSSHHPVLHGGSQYWIVATADGDAFMGWAWNNTAQFGRSIRINDQPWRADPSFASAAFRVRGSQLQTVVPEPTPLLLAGPALIGFIARRISRASNSRRR